MTIKYSPSKFGWTKKELKDILKFPVKVWLKENGYLGLMSWYKDNFFIASKSTSKGDYAEKLREILYEDYDIGNKPELETYLKENDCTLLFEVIDPDFDPHIIQYDHRKIILLDIVKNQIKTEYLTSDLEKVAKMVGCETKRLWCECQSWEELDAFMERIKADHHLYIEGFVMEDSEHFMFKYKTVLYKFWKHVRSKRGIVSKIAKDWYPVFRKEIEWMKEHPKEIDLCRYDNGEVNVIKLQKMYFGEGD